MKPTDSFPGLYIVIPAYNEESRISKCIQKSLDLGLKNIIVINDASQDNTAKIASQFQNVTVLSHLINLGPGAATQTGIQYAIEHNAEYIATIDADFQHDPADIIPLYEKILAGDSDLIVGSRFLESNDIPRLRIFYNKFGNFISYLLTQKYLTDSQSGLKIITARLARELAIETNGFEFCMEIISSARKLGAKITEIPISVSYTEDTTKKGQNLASGISMMSRILSPFN